MCLGPGRIKLGTPVAVAAVAGHSEDCIDNEISTYDIEHMFRPTPWQATMGLSRGRGQRKAEHNNGGIQTFTPNSLFSVSPSTHVRNR